ncbi:MAG: LacI family DNA-binding transcriptional regulator [Capsulimonadaceae bacterium]|nr:LacI family DNA-binding transcriptional regulator [Capsulimonadaceae bacterium]
MTVSIREVAKRAGVTHGTVSKVLGGNPKYSIPQSTRQRILSAVDELGYRPNYLAQSLKLGRTDIYGFYSGSRHFEIPNAYIANILEGLRAGCNECEKDLLLVGTFRGTDPVTVYNALANGKIDGLVVFMYEYDALCAALANSSLPVVAIVDPVPSIPSVSLDEQMGGRLIAEHLAERGHRRVVYCTAYAPMASALERHAAFLREAERLGLAVLEFADHAGFEELDAYMALPVSERPTAVVCWHDRAAESLLGHCSDLGISVPTELAVIGFDGVPFSPESQMRLTTVVAPWRDVAREAVRLLDRRVAGDAIPPLTHLSVEFKEGATG